MELFLLLCSMVSTFVSSFLLSVLLVIRSLPLYSINLSPQPDGATARIYEGSVRHSRTKPVANSFEYPVRYALFDLDSAPQISHLSADRAREAAGTNGPVFLLTIPASVGYEQNPLRVYYCYHFDGKVEEGGEVSSRLKNCIAEVTNTPWGEKVFFVFSPGSDLVAKPLHVSPFMDMLGNWKLRVDEPGEKLYVAISVQHPTLGNYFNATLSADRVQSSSTSSSLNMYFWLMPHKVALWIYWQAVKLWWKNVPFIAHPKYSNATYRDEALCRNDELKLSCKAGECVACEEDGEGTSRTRWCTWRDAQWPWS
ncbi:hypothetical protein HPP92_012186 [Vanilla planifolia]|uniref:Uncharacterized protein n=1 Tax=Vanilla planifolia TaxID=51239 RepID=A0A835V1H6_VANPL|nr:hypothetical protein HPP92_012186 [Vanilla planifolia]